GGVPVHRDGQAEVSTQRGLAVVGPEDSALLQDRDHLVDHPAEVRGMVYSDVEAVTGARLPPLDELVGHRLRGADELAFVELPGRLDRLAQRPAVLDRTLRDGLRPGVEGTLAVLERLCREGRIQVVLLEVVPAERAPE